MAVAQRMSEDAYLQFVLTGEKERGSFTMDGWWRSRA